MYKSRKKKKKKNTANFVVVFHCYQRKKGKSTPLSLCPFYLRFFTRVTVSWANTWADGTRCGRNS